ncbi:dCTP deaminase [Candidatus Dojkabacteria bacterium]|uniref:dCTP deaminase, dUMP-forming n=1 Tax=Candidatus Dojkabacteria bacterium TaxID=2099670 RepID=A0A3M0Z093_9BACT|nr:MAG: dCTP deaminase [Candidatus Dojkabacteria bacterium]
MILSDKKIVELIDKGDLVITNLNENSIQPASVDVTIGDFFLVIDDLLTSVIDMCTPIKYREIQAEEIILPAKSFVLATTREYIKLPNNLTAFVEGRSSVGRMGLFIQNAGWVDPGFEGKITLELYNANSLPIKIKAGRRIGQLVFCQMDQEAEKPYRGKYQGQMNTVGSRIYQDPD